jgi:hypothetical protein
MAIASLSLPPIVDVWYRLGGEPLRQSGAQFRGRAFWRDGDGWNVSVEAGKGVWKDFAANHGGGVLDLVVQVRGGSRAEAAQWLGLTSESVEMSERRRWAARRARAERIGQGADDWRSGLLELLEEAKAEAFRSGDMGTLELAASALYRAQRASSATIIEMFLSDPNATAFVRIGREGREHIHATVHRCVEILGAAQLREHSE